MWPILDSFFQSTLTNNISKFSQPAYITVSFIFVLLNIVFISPDLVAHNVVFIVNLLGSNAILQTIIVATVVLVLGHLLMTFQSTILKFMAGELWSQSF